MSQTPFLSILTFLPLVGAIIIMLLPRPKDLPEAHGDHDPDDAHAGTDAPAPAPADSARNIVNGVALFSTIATFVVSLAIFFQFRSGYVNAPMRNMQFIEDHPWLTMATLNIRYFMGVDGISLLLILLTTFLMVLCVYFSFSTRQRLKEFMVFLLLLETGMIGVFCALDLVLFYIFWEAMLIPMYFLIGIFGHERRVYAAIKFFIFTFAGSVLMLVAIIFVHQVAGTFDVLQLSNHFQPGPGMTLAKYNPQALLWMFAAFSLAFMIKVPMFPFHTWLPDAHVEAPTAGSVILAGVMLKMGTYGFLRFCLPIFPDQAHLCAPLFITLAIIGIVYGSIVAAVQPDAKKLVAYSSVAHLGFVILGIFTFTRIGMMGALVQNINHGISTPMLFFLVGMLYERRHTRLISEFGGLKKIVPMMATMLLLATLSSIAVPFFNGFVGEFPVLLGSWISTTTRDGMAGYGPTAVAATGMVLSAVYMLWWFQRLMLGPVTKPANRHLPDLSRAEWLVLTPLVVIIFWFGLGSGYWTRRMETSVNMLLPLSAQRVDSELPIAALLNPVSAEDDQGEFHPHRLRGNAPAVQPAPPQNPGGSTNPSGRRNGQEAIPPNTTPPPAGAPGPSEPMDGATPPPTDGAEPNGEPGSGKPGAAPPNGATPGDRIHVTPILNHNTNPQAAPNANASPSGANATAPSASGANSGAPANPAAPARH